MGTARACAAAGEGAPVWKKRALGPALSSSFPPWRLGNSSGRRASPELQSRAASGTPGVGKDEPCAERHLQALLSSAQAAGCAPAPGSGQRLGRGGGDSWELEGCLRIPGLWLPMMGVSKWAGSPNRSSVQDSMYCKKKSVGGSNEKSIEPQSRRHGL